MSCNIPVQTPGFQILWYSTGSGLDISFRQVLCKIEFRGDHNVVASPTSVDAVTGSLVAPACSFGLLKTPNTVRIAASAWYPLFTSAPRSPRIDTLAQRFERVFTSRILVERPSFLQIPQNSINKHPASAMFYLP